MKKSTEASGRTLWLGVAAGFLLLALAWAGLFTAARSAKVAALVLRHSPPTL